MGVGNLNNCIQNGDFFIRIVYEEVQFYKDVGFELSVQFRVVLFLCDDDEVYVFEDDD